MKHRPTLAALALALATLNAQLSTALAQGSLTPPGAPAPTMKSLNQIEPRIPITSLPYNITTPGSYYVTTNLAGSSGIAISSGNVTVDLNGFTLQGMPGSTYGVYTLGNVTNLAVRNGIITGWGYNAMDASSFGSVYNAVFEHLTVSTNGDYGIVTRGGGVIRDCFSFGNAFGGFFTQGGEIINCFARTNGGFGFAMYYGTLTHCHAEYNSQHGISLTSSQALDCLCVSNGGYGIVCFGTGNEIRGCRILYSGYYGIYFPSSSGENTVEACDIENSALDGINSDGGAGSGGSIIARNHIALNARNGIALGDNNDSVKDNHIVLNAGGGIALSGSNNDIEDNNVVTTNGVDGIAVIGSAYTNNVVAKNVVVGGGSAGVNYFNPGNNDFGPIGAAATATSPWANISH